MSAGQQRHLMQMVSRALRRKILLPMAPLSILAAANPCGPSRPSGQPYDWDLSAAGICYSISGDQLKVKGLIQNVGIKMIDFGITKPVGPNNAPPKASYAVGGDVQGAPHGEIQDTLTGGGLDLKPGEKRATSQGLELPFHTDNKYANFEFVVTLEGDQNPGNNRYMAFKPGNVTGADLEKMQDQYKCPSP